MPEPRRMRATTLPMRVMRRPPGPFCGDPECHEPVVEGKRFCGPHLARLLRIKAELDAAGDWKVTLHRPGRGLEEAA